MIAAHAERIVAAVADAQARQQRTVLEFIGKAMRPFHRLGIDAEPPVLARPAAAPVPAAPSLLHALPESIRGTLYANPRKFGLDPLDVDLVVETSTFVLESDERAGSSEVD